MKDRFFQNIHVVNALPALSIADDFFDVGTSAITDIVNLSNYDRATFIMQLGAGATGTGTITIESCDDVSASTATAITFDAWKSTTSDVWSDRTSQASFATTAGAGATYAFEVNASELSGTDKFVRLKALELVNGAVTGNIICILSNARYMHEVKQTAIV
ncbi:MAG: hypothetical protein GQ540_03545 [Lutibacter sp.]|uniref:hypothetical protein n=1 Tax=Lutibacter sp. TaxID=1925666 RepID=UPI0019EC5801|nr:hypothetical protein [Lutibacter sp.]NOR27586.1 hypothetical protein [Lutibacter sp.]